MCNPYKYSRHGLNNRKVFEEINEIKINFKRMKK